MREPLSNKNTHQYWRHVAYYRNTTRKSKNCRTGDDHLWHTLWRNALNQATMMQWTSKGIAASWKVCTHTESLSPTSLLMRVVSRTPVYRSWTRTLSGWKKSGLFSSLGRIHLQWWERREQLSNVFKYLCHRLMRHLLLHCDTYVLLSCVWVLIQHRGWTQHNLT